MPDAKDLKIIFAKIPKTYYQSEQSYWCFEYDKIEQDYWNSTRKNTYKLSYYVLSNMIVSMGEIKIKNYLVKNYNAIKETTNVAFHTEEDAKAVLEWIKQKVFETTLIGTEKIEAEVKQKQEANRQKRLNKEAEVVKNEADKIIAQYQKYINKTINLPLNCGRNILTVPATLLDIKLQDDFHYELVTSIGNIVFHYKSIEFSEKGIKTKYFPGGDPKVSIHGELDIKFE